MTKVYILGINALFILFGVVVDMVYYFVCLGADDLGRICAGVQS